MTSRNPGAPNVTAAFVAYLAALAGPTWLGLRSSRRGRRPVTEPGRLIDHGQIMDPDRLARAVD